MEFLYEYGLFLAKVVTFVLAIVIIIAIIASSAMKSGEKKGELELTDLSEEFRDVEEDITHYLLTKEEFKEKQKKDKKGSIHKKVNLKLIKTFLEIDQNYVNINYSNINK